eukprot:Hpha_TRINITY_DN16788_c0_g3::TRINITY_DN16788_c0_g3_i1::g.79707::m.79707
MRRLAEEPVQLLGECMQWLLGETKCVQGLRGEGLIKEGRLVVLVEYSHGEGRCGDTVAVEVLVRVLKPALPFRPTGVFANPYVHLIPSVHHKRVRRREGAPRQPIRHLLELEVPRSVGQPQHLLLSLQHTLPPLLRGSMLLQVLPLRLVSLPHECLHVFIGNQVSVRLLHQHNFRPGPSRPVADPIRLVATLILLPRVRAQSEPLVDGLSVVNQEYITRVKGLLAARHLEHLCFLPGLLRDAEHARDPLLRLHVVEPALDSPLHQPHRLRPSGTLLERMQKLPRLTALNLPELHRKSSEHVV